MLRLVLGFLAMSTGSVLLARLGVMEWGFWLRMLGIGPVVLVGGLLMGLHEDPPPWRRRRAGR